MSAPPIACMLSGQDFKARLAWIADLNRRSLKQTHLDDLQLTLSYEQGALRQVEELVERERACCPFLSFGIQSDKDSVSLSITAPEDAREAANSIFEPFISASQSSGCSYCGSAA